VKKIICLLIIVLLVNVACKDEDLSGVWPVMPQQKIIENSPVDIGYKHKAIEPDVIIGLMYCKKEINEYYISESVIFTDNRWKRDGIPAVYRDGYKENIDPQITNIDSLNYKLKLETYDIFKIISITTSITYSYDSTVKSSVVIFKSVFTDKTHQIDFDCINDYKYLESDDQYQTKHNECVRWRLKNLQAAK